MACFLQCGVVDQFNKEFLPYVTPIRVGSLVQFPNRDRIRHHVRELAFPVPAERTQIRYAQLGSDAGFIGAAGCGRLLVKGRSL